MSHVQKTLKGTVERLSEAVRQVGVSPEERLALASYARERADEGSLSSAREVLEALVDLEPESSYFHTCLGALEFTAEDWERAEVLLARAKSLDEGAICARLHLAEMYAVRGQAARALTELRSIASTGEPEDRFVKRAQKLIEWLSQDAPIAARAGGGY